MPTALTQGSDKDRVLIFDTTLRDGEQCPGATMTLEEKIEVAELLDQMGVDIIEAGFPITSTVARARNHVEDVEWSAEDGTRTEPDFLCRCVEAAIKAGAATINIPDTVGYTVPEEYFALIKMLRERVPNADKARFSAHCHDDLGMAVANSLARVRAGIRQIECTINGIGERGRDASLEEVVVAMKVRNDVLAYW